MPIKTACPNCDSEYTLADATKGKRVRCKKCSETFTVEESADRSSLEPLAGSRSRHAWNKPKADSEEALDVVLAEDQDDSPRGRRRSRDDEPRGRGRRRSRGRKGSSLWLWGGLGCGFLLMVGVGVVVFLFATGIVGNKVTPENAKKIKHGMTKAEVIDILGKPDTELSTGTSTTMMWIRNDAAITIGLHQNRVNAIAMQFSEGFN